MIRARDYLNTRLGPTNGPALSKERLSIEAHRLPPLSPNERSRPTRAGVGFTMVLGAPEYYRRFGIRSANLLGLENEYGGDDALMALELKAGSITRELVGYAREFSDLAGPI